MSEVNEEGSNAQGIRDKRRCKGPEAEKCLTFSRGRKTVLMKVRTYIYNDGMSKPASI